MEKVTIIIPIFNILKRGYKRIDNSIESLLLQKDHIDKIIIVDGSNDREYSLLNRDIKDIPEVLHVRKKLDYFNKSVLLNYGIGLADSKWIMCTDCDYLFRIDFLSKCEDFRSDKRILFKEVKMLRNMRIEKDQVKKWNFPNSKFNEWGHLANGACQYASALFFKENPYPEGMSGFGAMDNIMAYIAYNKGLEITWLIDSEILHQYHRVEKFRNSMDSVRFKNNQAILAKYIQDNNLPTLLTKTR
jgi:glycosyltransferase involved in cell wall biosynthesis